MVKLIIFDMDGVIIDSLNSNVKYFQDLLQMFGYKKPKASKIKKLFHLTSKDTIRKLLPHEKEEKIIKIWKSGSKIYPKYISYINLNPEIKNVLKKLSEKYMLCIVTSRRRKSVKIILNHFKLDKFFKSIIAFEDYKHPKPHPEPLLKAFKKLKVKPQETIYIGDSLVDFKSAKRAGTKVIIYNKKRINVRPRVNSFKNIIPLIESMV